MSSKDPILGQKIKELLIAKNLENPVNGKNIAMWGTEEHLNVLSSKMAEFLEILGLDLNDNSIKKTPHRVVDFLIRESFYGLNYNNFPRVSTNDNLYEYHELLISSGVVVHSTCEHHLVSITGEAVVAYIPNKHIVGLSKINRVVDFFARRPQVQERMTRQIFVTLQEVLHTEDVAVAITAKHNCIVVRGVKNSGTENITFALGGKFNTVDTFKNTFYQSIMIQDN